MTFLTQCFSGLHRTPDREQISRVLDVGRVLAATIILYFHLGCSSPYSFGEWGIYAVTFFLIAAGVVAVGFARVSPTSLGEGTRCLWHRIVSLWPLFALVNVLLFAGSFLYPSTLGRPFTWVEFLLSVSGLSQYVGTRYLSVLMWFVPYVLQLCLLLPLFLWGMRRAGHTRMLGAAFVVSGLLSWLVFQSVPSAQAGEICRHWSPVFRAPEMMLGVVLGTLVFDRASLGAFLKPAGIYAAFSVVLAMLGGLHPDASFSWFLELSLFGELASLAVLIAAWPLANRLHRHPRFLRVAGVASYPFFLIHSPAINAVVDQFGFNPIVWIGYALGCWGAALALAVVFFPKLLRKKSMDPTQHGMLLPTGSVNLNGVTILPGVTQPVPAT